TGAHVQANNAGWDGLSIDHLDSGPLEFYFNTVVDTLLADAGDLLGKSLKYLHTDSWEMGPVSWTAKFREEFRQRRGYDMTPYLAVLAGKIVDSRDISNRFLADVRRTIGDCIADNHYARFAELAHGYGLKIHPESGGPHSAPIDALLCLGRNDIPMGEFWARSQTHRIRDQDRLFGKQAASAAHIYGKKLVNAEGFTTIGPQWQKDPWDLKPVADRVFCEGVNRIFFHQFSCSPPDFGKPGFESFAGTHINPNVTWWEKAPAWTGYLSRCQFLLQQGLFVADVCYYYGDDVPNFVPLKSIDPSLGFGYDYDMINTEVLLQRMSFDNGRFVLPDGMSYRILVLPEQNRIRPAVLQKLAGWVKSGATVVGPRPLKSPGLANYPQCDSLVKALSAAMWGQCNGYSIKAHSYGKGRVFWNRPLRRILLSDGVLPDFDYKSRQEGTLFDFIHRRVDDTDIYFVINRNSDWREAECRFRVDKIPEVWNPASGETERQVLFSVEEGLVSMPLRLEPYGSRFIVFRSKAKTAYSVTLQRNGRDLFAEPGEPVPDFAPAKFAIGKSGKMSLQAWRAGRYEVKSGRKTVAQINVDTIPDPVAITGPWELIFPHGWGAPASVVFETLQTWTRSSDPGIRYFSGTALYRKTIDLPAAYVSVDRSCCLDLGRVKNIAEVRVNGKFAAILWKRPFRVDITDLIRAGSNDLEIEITNLWPNRLIGDCFLPEEERYAQTNITKFDKSSPLMPSGLLGPVRLVMSENHLLR
ncbi:glycoside hydrolase family 2, partial [candidate division KSB1 bacterium]|nr:glycoside hydrolase family 2 [candidate division KSB1 bacterium]